MKEPLVKVSILMPCFNGAKTVSLAVKGIVNQTYNNIQFIFINDGSTDNSLEIVKELEKEILDAGIELVVINQENKGLGGAIDAGLKVADGKYLAWVDADDELLPESVEKRVAFLEANPSYDSVSSDAYLVTETDWNHPIGKACYNPSVNAEENQFVHMLLGKSLFCPGCHLIRFDSFIKANGGRDIYPAKHGQNWQLLLPIYYGAKHGYIDEPLYKYRVSASSMSSFFDTASTKEIYDRRKEYLDLVHATLNRIQRMSTGERKMYWKMYKKYVFDNNIETAVSQKKSIEKVYWRIRRFIEIGK